MRLALDKRNTELEEYQQELLTHFIHSSELLDNMVRNYRQLYQHMAKSSKNLLPPNLLQQEYPFRFHLNETKEYNDQGSLEIPRDYSEGASGLLRDKVFRRH